MPPNSWSPVDSEKRSKLCHSSGLGLETFFCDTQKAIPAVKKNNKAERRSRKQA